MNILYNTFWVLLFLSSQNRLCNSLDDIDIYRSSIPFCRQAHSQSVIKSYIADDDIHSIINEKVYIFGGKGVNYQRLNSNYLEDLWELSIDQSASEVVDNKFVKSTDIKYDFNWLQIKHLPYRNNWPSRRSNFASTVISPFAIINSTTLSTSISGSSNRIYSDFLLIYGGENDITFTKCDSNTNSMKQKNNIDTSSHISHQEQDDMAHERKPEKKQLLKDLWLFNIADTNKPWINILGDSSQSCDTSISEHHLINSTNNKLSLHATTNKNNKDTAVTNPFLDNYKTSQGRYDLSIDPGPRKSSILAVLPITSSVLLFGGYGYLSNKYPQNNDGNTTINTTSSNNNNINNNNYNNNHNSIELGHNHGYSDRKCLADLYQLDIATAINKNDHQITGIWKRLADLNGPCLYGPAGIGVLDTFDSREKLFLFGGRYSSSSSSSSPSTTINPHNYSTTTTYSQFNKSHLNVNNNNNKVLLSNNEEYLFSNSIWLYTLSSDTWHEIKRPSSNSNSWPPGRIYHSISYVSERNTVFISGGVLETTNEYSSDLDDDQHSNDQIKEDDIARGRRSRKNKYSHHLDIWSFDLQTRSWTCHDSGLHSSSEVTYHDDDHHHNSNDNKQEVDIETLYPDMRSYNSLSVLQLNNKLNTDMSNTTIPHLYLMTFGGKWISDVIENNINEKIETRSRKLSLLNHYQNNNFITSHTSSFLEMLPSYTLSVWKKSFFNTLLISSSSSSSSSTTTTRSLAAINQAPTTLVTLPEMNDIWLYKLAMVVVQEKEKEKEGSKDETTMPPPQLIEDKKSNGTITVVLDHKLGEEYWIFLSVGGCHAFDDGHLREPLDVVAIVVLIAIAASILFGLCFYKILRPMITQFDARYRGYSNLSDYSDTISIVMNEITTTTTTAPITTNSNIPNIINNLPNKNNKSYESTNAYQSTS